MPSSPTTSFLAFPPPNSKLQPKPTPAPLTFLQTIHGESQAHNTTSAESSYYRDEVNQMLERNRLQNFSKSVEDWKVGVNARCRREDGGKEKERVEKEEVRKGWKERFLRITGNDYSSDHDDDDNNNNNDEEDKYNATTTTMPSSPTLSLPSPSSPSSPNKFQQTINAKGKASLYTKSIFLTEPVPEYPLSMNGRFGIMSSPFTSTLRRKYERTKRHDREREEYRRQRKVEKKKSKLRKGEEKFRRTEERRIRLLNELEVDWHKLNDIPQRPRIGTMVHEDEELLLEDEKKYFEEEGRCGYFEVYKRLHKDRQIIPVGASIKNYQPPKIEFDVDLDTNHREDDEDESDQYDDEGNFFLTNRVKEPYPTHKTGIFAEDNLSPRHRLNRWIIDSSTILPEPLLIRRHLYGADGFVNDRIDLGGRSLGDGPIGMLSDVIDELPVVRHVNLRDNRLTDLTLKKVVKSLTDPDRPMHLLSLDLSQNVIDTTTALSLAQFLRSKLCVLEELFLSKADVDDTEMAAFCISLLSNKTLKTLDVSHNIIGGAREYMSKGKIGEKQLTGGESVAMALKMNDTLTKLDLSWNQMGVKSAELMGDMLSSNKTLKWLSLGYNCIQNQGAVAIFSGLAHNKSLEELCLSSNQLGPRSCHILSATLLTNRCLKMVIIDGNPISNVGARAVIRSMRYWPEGREVNMNSCDLTRQARIGKAKPVVTKFGTYEDQSGEDFDSADPVGYYKLNLEESYSQYIVRELYLLASLSSGFFFKMLRINNDDVHFDEPPGSQLSKIKLNGIEMKDAEFSNKGYKFDANWRFKTHSVYTELVAEETIIEFEKYKWLDKSTNKPWVCPKSGNCEIVFHYSPMPQAEPMLANKTQITNIVGWCNKQPAMRTEIITMFAQDGYLLASQLQGMLDEMNNSHVRPDATELYDLVKSLMPICIDYGSIETIMTHNLSVKQVLKLQLEFGELFEVLMGSCCSHYVIDLQNKYERLAMLKLAELNTFQKSRLQILSEWPLPFGGTSQLGNWEQFRNTVFSNDGNRLNDNFFLHRLRNLDTGVVEFDFVSSQKISRSAPALNDLQFNEMLSSCEMYISVLSRAKPNDLANKIIELVQLSSAQSARIGADNHHNNHNQGGGGGGGDGGGGEGGGGGGGVSSLVLPPVKETGANVNVNLIGPVSKKKRDDTPKTYVSPLSPATTLRKRHNPVHNSAAVVSNHSTSYTPTSRNKLLKSVELVRQNNQLNNLFLSSHTTGLSIPKILTWLKPHNPKVDKWTPSMCEQIFESTSNGYCEFTATSPPARIEHTLKFRVIHKLQNKGLEFCPPSSTFFHHKKAWISMRLKVFHEKPTETPQSVAERACYEIFREHRLEFKIAKKLASVQSVFKKTIQRNFSPVEPQEVPGVLTVSYVHYVNVIIEGLPETDFTTVSHARDMPGVIKLFALTAVEKCIKWNWANLADIKDVAISYDNLPSKIRQVRLKIGTRVFTCKQANTMARLVPIADGEYDFHEGEECVVLRKVGIKNTQLAEGKIKSIDPATGAMHVVYQDGSEDRKVTSRHCYEAQHNKRIGFHLREDLIVSCFNRVKDMENFNYVMETLPPKGRVNVANRLGWLNVFNPMHPEGHLFELDLKVPDHWILANILTKLLIVENGTTFCCPGDPCGSSNRCLINVAHPCQIHWYRDDRLLVDGSRAPGFVIPISWDDPSMLPDPCDYKPSHKAKQDGSISDRVIPREGRFFAYYANDNSNLPVEKLRTELRDRYCFAGVETEESDPLLFDRRHAYRFKDRMC